MTFPVDPMTKQSSYTDRTMFSWWKTWIILTLPCFASCAEIATPQGGPKDSDPPLLLEADPPMESVLVEPKEVVLRFDEFFEIKDAFNQVLLSPPMSEQPALIIKGKDLYITFPDSFLPDKTYTLQFGDAVRDQNEGNILKNFQYVFSTGPIIDSLTLVGQILDRLTGEPDKDMLVMLYPDSEPELVTKGRPYYFARSDASGNFKLNNLQAGSYRIFALGDQNFNYQYDLPNEKIGFLDSLILVDTTSVNYTLFSFTEQNGNGQLSKAKSLRYGKLELLFNGNADTGSISLSGNPESTWEWNANRDSLQLWIKDLELDSIRVFQTLDSINVSRLVLLKTADRDSLAATTKLTIQPSFTLPLGGKKPENPSPLQVISFDLGKSLWFRIPNPGSTLDTLRFLLQKEPNGDTLLASVRWANPQQTTFEILAALQAEERYRLRFLPGFIQDWYGLSTDSATYVLQLKAQKEYGKVSFQLTLPDSAAFVFELLDTRNQVVRSEKLIESGLYTIAEEYLLPGNYRARLIADKNRNGRWDPGNYSAGKMAETVSYFKENIVLRADWHLEFDWDNSIPQNSQ